MKRLLLAAVALLATAAFAQTGRATEPRPRAEPKPLVVIFTPDEITGEADSPNGVVIETVQRPDFPSFFKVRENFDDKLRESVNEL